MILMRYEIDSIIGRMLILYNDEGGKSLNFFSSFVLIFNIDIL